jgi:DNA polymerase-4
MQAELTPILDKVWRYCEQSGVRGRTVTLKVKFADFQQITRSRSMPTPIGSRSMLEQASLELLSGILPVPQGVRLLGVTLSSLNTEPESHDPQIALAL